MVSIVLVAFNSESFIKKTLLSCLNQKFRNIEILILDNASVDNTLNIIREFSDPRIKIFESEKNIGPYNGLNLLLEKANGEYIAIQDHDDIWFPDKIPEQVYFLDSHKDFIGCGTNVYYYFEDKKIFIEKKFNSVTDRVNHTSLVFRNNKFRYDNSFKFPEEYFEKVVLAQHGRIGCIQKSLTIHRIRSDNGNLSKARFRLNKNNIKEIFLINGFNQKTVKYVLYLIFRKVIPENLVWFIRNEFTMKSWKRINNEEFKKIYPEIEF